MRKLPLLLSLLTIALGSFSQIDPYSPDPNPPTVYPGYKLVWSDEFNYTGKPSSANWSYETGFVRNEEHQWYQSDNANCANGALQIVGRKERFKNPNYVAGSSNWKTNREYVDYTAASIHTRGKKSWKYGRFEIRAKIPAVTGAWPAIWTLGDWGEWPTNGEIDIMEYYGDGILANAAWGSNQQWVGTWDSSKTPMSYFKGKDANWANKYHVWVMDWTPEFIKLYLDGELLNTIETYKTLNADGTNPFTSRNHYVLLNLALGGTNGGDPSKPNYPITYFVDYFRVYQLDDTDNTCFQPLDAAANLAPDPACDKLSPDGTGSRKLCRDLMKVYCGNFCGQITGGTYAQYINWTAGKSYRVRAMVYANGNDVVLGANAADGSVITQQAVDKNLYKWQMVDFVFTAPDATGTAKSGIFLAGASGSLIDNVEVYETTQEFVSVTRSKLNFNLTNRTATFRVTGHQLSADLEINAPYGISLDKNTITPAEAATGVVVTATFDGSRPIAGEFIRVTNTQHNIPVEVLSSLTQINSNNLIENWDAGGMTGAGSEPDKHGWIANGSVTWRTANATADVRYTDQTTSGSYTLNGNKWSGRVFHPRWDGGVTPGNTFAYPVELEAGKVYTFSGLYGWQANGGSYSIYSIGVNTHSNNKGLSLAAHHKTLKKQDVFKLEEFMMVFRPQADGTHYITFDNTEKLMGAVAQLKVREGIFLPAEISVVPSTATFNATFKTRTISVQGKYVKENIQLRAPDGIALSRTEITPDEANAGFVSVTLTFDGSRDIANGLIEIECENTLKTIAVTAQSFETSVNQLFSQTDFRAFALNRHVSLAFELTYPGTVQFEVFTIHGQKLSTFAQSLESGAHSITLPDAYVPGNYLLKMTLNSQTQTKKLLVF